VPVKNTDVLQKKEQHQERSDEIREQLNRTEEDRMPKKVFHNPQGKKKKKHRKT
jgi:hypothetical protein